MEPLSTLVSLLMEKAGTPGLMVGLCLFIYFKIKGFQVSMRRHDEQAETNHTENRQAMERRHRENQARFGDIDRKMEEQAREVHKLAVETGRQGSLLELLIDEHSDNRRK